MGKRFLKAKWKRKQELGDLDVFIDEESIERIIPKNGCLQVGLCGSSEVYVVSSLYTYTIDNILARSGGKSDGKA